MKLDLHQRKIAVIGGNDPCCDILNHLLGKGLAYLGCKVLLLADPLIKNNGVVCADALGVPTTTTYGDVLDLAGLDLVLKLKNDESLAPILKQLESRQIEVLDLDSYQVISFVSLLKTEEEKIRVREKISNRDICRDDLVCLFDTFSGKITDIANMKNEHLLH